MSQKDTALLGEILSSQKALLKYFQDKDKKGEDGDGGNTGTAKVDKGGKGGNGSFSELLTELQDLNKTSKRQLEVLERIDKSIAGGMGSSGGTTTIKSSGDIGELGGNLVSLSLGILAVVGAIAALSLIAVLIPAAMIGAVGAGLIILGFNKLFEYVGQEEFAQKVESGTKNLFHMAGAVALFTLSVVLSSLAIQQVGFEGLAMSALAIMGFAGVFYLMGKGSETIEDGAKAAAWMGVGMASIAIGIAALAISLKFAGDLVSGGGGGSVVVGAIAGIGILAVSALAFYFMGQYANQIEKGAIATAAIGLGLVFFGAGLTVYLMGISKVMGVGSGAVEKPEGPFATIGNMMVGLGIVAVGAMSLILYGTVFSLLGVLQEAGIPELAIPPGTPLAGALGFALIGLALLPFAFGYDYYMSKVSKWMGTGEEGAGQELSVQALMNGYLATTGGIMTLLLVGTIFAAAGLAAPLILPGVFVMGLAGLALYSLGAGIEAFMEKVPPGTEIGDELKTNLAKIRDAFLTFVGEEDLASAGVFGTLKGLIRGGATAGTLAAALASAMLIGPALSSIAQGLSVFANIENAPKIIGYDEHGQPIFDKKGTVNLYDSIDNITSLLPKVIQPFIDLSTTADLTQKDNVLSLLTGIQLGESPFARGVSVAGQIGTVLSALAQGIGAFADITQAPKITGYDSKGQPIYSKKEPVNLLLSIDNISTAITAVLQPFVDLSKNAKLGQGQNLLSILTGIQLTESPFSRGVQIAGQIGAVLSSIAQGIGSFGDLTQLPKITGYDDKGQPIYSKEAPVNLLDSADNIGTALTEVIKPFIDLANNAALQQVPSLLSIYTGIQLGESPFARGVNTAGRIGEVLSSMAVGIGNFANLKQAKKIKSYDDKGQPIYDTTEVFDIIASAGNLMELLSIGGTGSIIDPFINIANEIENTKPRSLLGWIEEALTGNNSSQSPLELGITVGLQIGEILSNIAAGMGQMANLAAVPVINGYDKEGRPTYGPPVNALASLDNFGQIMGDLMEAFIRAGKDAEEHVGSSSGMEGLGPTISGILGAVVDSLDSFSNPNKLKKIKGYTENGKPIYYENEFVDIDVVVDNMVDIVTRVIKAFGTKEINKAMDLLDIDDDEMIGDYLGLFVKPIEGFVKIAGEVNARTGGDLYALTDAIIYATKTMTLELGELSRSGSEMTVSLFGRSYSEFGQGFTKGMRELLEFDMSDPGFYKTEANPTGSALIGVAENVTHSLSSLASGFGVGQPGYLVEALSGSQTAKKILQNIQPFPGYMKAFNQAKPKEFGDGATYAFDGLKTITQVATKGKGAGFTHLKLFTDQIDRLAGASTAFERFAKAFGKMSDDMGKFASNFKLMNEDGIYAFKEWTGAIVELSTANPSTFAANVITAKKAIDAGFNEGENPPIVDIADNDPSRGKEIIKQNVESGDKPPKKPGPASAPKMPTAAEIGKAVSTALTSALDGTILTVRQANANDLKNQGRKR